ncbi:nucleoside recognition domain-containing protein [Lachnoclostridium phytofermentans]|uniref:Nucleoside recognition domain protein n=1 Tax=Lachnoclostridium phytofermentans (strain ATCC 700394 / DSM 18823 / ISDg) TaxID=357809 RepID=A9KNV0_LACP7|nr:nucleoside recognition domain-containing protein [Lachnoclostridium phytofermentans]ABX41701.1 nucleoside recognition domain protein [Lachnoclostridium phytofermentans ISDg]
MKRKQEIKYRKASVHSSIFGKGRLLKGGLLLLLILMLIFPIASLEGAKSGLMLWFETVLPALLPFMILSGLLIRLRVTKVVSVFLYPVLKHLFPISKEGCYPIFIGFLSGIPVGAKTTADMFEQQLISKKEAQFLCALCNNASPMFIISYIAASKLKRPDLGYMLLIVLFASSAVSSLIIYYIKEKFSKKKETSKINQNKSLLHAFQLSNDTDDNISNHKIIPQNPAVIVKQKHAFEFHMLDDAILSGFEVVTKVGGYIILFSVLASLLLHMKLLPPFVAAFISAILEITTGIDQLSRIPFPDSTKIILITTITAFGGLSGFAQTKSVINTSGLSLFQYFITKTLSMVCAFAFSTLYVLLLL